MDYGQLVDKYIKDSGLSLGEIAKRMQDEKGIKIDRSYISKLRNNPKYPASEEINRALAEITGGDPEELILAGYYEKAPIEVKTSLDQAKSLKIFLADMLAAQSNHKLSHEEIQKKIDYLFSLPLEEYENEIIRIYNDIATGTPEQLFDYYKAIIKDTDSETMKLADVEKLKKLRISKKLSESQAAKIIGIDESLYHAVEVSGAITTHTVHSMELNNIFNDALKILESYNSELERDQDENAQFEEFINNPEHGIFFKDYLNAPEERREEMRQIFKILMEKEKDRKPGDRQGE